MKNIKITITELFNGNNLVMFSHVLGIDGSKNNVECFVNTVHSL